MIRPRPARWFAILAARDDATLLLEALAATGAVELEARATATLPPGIAEARPLLQQFEEFAQRYRAYWPRSGLRPSAFPEAPATQLTRVLARLRAWAQEAEPIVAELQRCAAEEAELALWRRVVSAVGATPVDWSELAAAGPIVQARLFVLPPGALFPMPASALVRRLDLDGAAYALAVGGPEELEPVVAEVHAAKGRACTPPSWLRRDAAANAAYVAERQAALAARSADLAAKLEALHGRHDLRTALGDAHRLQWMARNVRALEAGEHFCWITGWTSDATGGAVESAVERASGRALVHFPPPPPGARAPLLLANPAWARPFEVFSRALGMPARHEVDPSVVLALVVPLIFGYMFGDAGQGLVLVAAGLALRGRWPIATLIAVGGAAAIAFGALFGSVFALHAFPPLWLAPLDDPLTILAVPLAGGAVLLTAGLLLKGVQAHWRYALRDWLAVDPGFIVAYLGLLAAPFDRAGLAVAACGALWFCAGHAAIERRAAAALAALVELVERLVQILINTLSFARVGAFALAHAGLSSAIVALMEASDNPVVRALVLVAGNAVVLLLEALVVSIQTTRLVLFEFFTRFLVAEGRVFRPLSTPPSWQEQ